MDAPSVPLGSPPAMPPVAQAPVLLQTAPVSVRAEPEVNAANCASRISSKSIASDVSFTVAVAAQVKPADIKLEPEGEPSSQKPAAAKAKKVRLIPSFVETMLLIYSAFYAAVSRVPFTLWAIYMIDVLGFPFLRAALTLGLYCFGRLVGAHLAGMYLGSVTMIFGTAAGGFAWGAILLFDNQWLFIIATFCLGFTETVTGLDTMLKIESMVLRRSTEQTQIIFRSQLISTCLGVFIAYMGGGFLYKEYGMPAVGVSCVMFSCINLGILAIMYPRRRVYRQPFIRIGDILAEVEANAPKGARKSRASVAGKKVGVRTRVSTYNIDAVEILDDGDDLGKSAGKPKGEKQSGSLPSEMKTPFFLGTVVACFFFTTLGISTQFAISALYWQKVWSVGPDVVGTIMAIGESLGVCLLVFFGQPAVFNSRATRYFAKPANVLTACLGMGILCWVITIDNKIVCAIGSVGVHMCNVCVHSFQAELIGVCATGEKFAKWISLSYVVKRAANCVCVFGSIVFFDAFGPQMSYRVIGSALITYAFALGSIYAMKKVMPCQR